MEKVSILRNVLDLEAQALTLAGSRITDEQVNKLHEIFDYLIKTGNSLVFCGVGKSGHIAVKLAATFSSLGLSSWFLHPTEALHGDLGRVSPGDAMVFLSYSGTTEEIKKLMPYVDVPKELRIGLIGNPNSPIKSDLGLTFDCSVEKEACLNNQAPTCSSTLALAMGDAMAVYYEHLTGLTKEGFAANHPGGILGKSLRIKVSDLMWGIDKCPSVGVDSTLKDVILAMTNKNVGGCAILDDSKKLLGIMVEGDIRRSFTIEGGSLESKVDTLMTKSPITISSDEKAYSALTLMEGRKNQIDILPVVTSENEFLGFIRLHDLIKEGFVQSSSKK